MLAQHMLRTAALLALFAIAGTALVAVTHKNTKDKIAQVERDALLRKLHAVVKPEAHDNDLYKDRISVTEEKLLGSTSPRPVFRARLKGKPVALILTPIAPDGYGGEIKLLLGIKHDGSISGVRVLTHRETPGLGDDIEERRSNWIFAFDGKSLANPDIKKWKVKKDGGAFDQFTGATISPRAIVKAIRNALQYYQLNRDSLFERTSENNAEPASKPSIKKIGQ